jgi:hypothetical protein
MLHEITNGAFKNINKNTLYLSPTLLFIMGHVLGGRVTVTDGECRLFIYYNYEHVITQQYLSAMESPICP